MQEQNQIVKEGLKPYNWEEFSLAKRMELTNMKSDMKVNIYLT